MKKQLILALALSVVSLSACEEEPEALKPELKVKIMPAITISSFHPMTAACGETVYIYGENFGTSFTDNYVTFNGAYAEVIEVVYNMVKVEVPQNLVPGLYFISLSANGQIGTATNAIIID